MHFLGLCYHLFVFIYVSDVFVVDHCHLIPLYCSWGGAVVPQFTQQGEIISAVTQHTAAGILIRLIVLIIVKCLISEWFFLAYLYLVIICSCD